MKNYLRGRYGAAPGPVSQEILELVLGDEQPITCRPGDLLTETLADYADEIGELAHSEEDLLSYAIFPQTARAFLEHHRVGPEADVFGTHEQHLASRVGSAVSGQSADRVQEIVHLVESSGVDEIVIEEGDLKVTVRKGAAAAPPADVTAPTAVPEDDADGYHVVRSPMVATFFRAAAPSSPPFVEVGDTVAPGETLCILEAMKLMNELNADIDGVVRAIAAENGQAVEYGQALFRIEPS
jgi:oxaloacetate decarboxylase alpha subunit